MTTNLDEGPDRIPPTSLNGAVSRSRHDAARHPCGQPLAAKPGQQSQGSQAGATKPARRTMEVSVVQADNVPEGRRP